jgi:tetratricopeptide (TPR) repeat protein
MKPSNKPLALALCVLLLSGCSLLHSKQTPKATPAGGALPGTSSPSATKPVDKGDPDARFKAALDLMKNQPQDAEAALTDLVKDFPQYSGPLTNLGLIYAKSKRLDLAASAFSKAVANNPQNAVAYNWQGMLYREAKDYGRAEQAYKHALSINGDYGNAQLNLGILYDVYLKRPADALPHYKEYQRISGGDDLRVLVWIADIEKAQADTRPATPAVAPAAAAAVPGPVPKTPEKKP